MKPSRIRQGVQDYLALRRRLGFALRGEGPQLLQFATFMARRHAEHITTALALAWAQAPKGVSAARAARRLAMVRRFAKYWSATDPRTEVPPEKLLPCKYQRQAPRICTDDELARLLQAARDASLGAELLARTYYTVFALLSVTGMRRGEVLGLCRDDADLVEGILTIRQTKFQKSRLVPVHETTRRALATYARFRDRVFPEATTDRFFVSDRGRPVARSTVDQAFVDLSHQIGMRGDKASRPSRLHDLRHRFAIRTVMRWYQSGADVEQRMPELSTYLGHTRTDHTYWYLSAVPELLQLASDRAARARRGRKLSRRPSSPGCSRHSSPSG